MAKVIKEKFVVIGKEGSTSDGDGFIQKLWEDGFRKGLIWLEPFMITPTLQWERAICIFS